MRRFIITSALLISIITLSFSQTEFEIWSKAKVFLNSRHTMKDLAGLGVETDHGKIKLNQYFTSAFSQRDLARIKLAGFEYEILVPDVVADFQNRNSVGNPDEVQADYFAGFCNKVKSYKIPKNWKMGTMGGHLKYEEMLLHLDSMRIKFPNLISAKAPIDTTKTHEGRTIWHVRLSDNPTISEPTEPQALFSAVHHAREPVGMHQLIFFMWYLLENYALDPEVKALMDNSELYFIPCVNPDGYIFNQTEQPNGGGMWRKNRRNNLDGSFGVDLNRNYGYNWGFDDFGSSPNSIADTYRGTAGFSEPETRAMKAFCERSNFKIGLNYHTYSNLVIHPWGYQNIQCEDSILFRNLTKEMTRENNYRIGTGMEVLNYNSNGSSDDFMYAPTPEKDKIMAMTPEVGDWFWPTQNQIKGLCVENVHQNMTILKALHPMVTFRDTTGVFLKAGTYPNQTGPRIRYKLTRTGTNSSQANFVVWFNPIGSNTVGIGSIQKSYSDLSLQQTIVDSILLPQGLSAFQQPQKLTWEVVVSNGAFAFRDTVSHFGGEPISGAAYFENCDNLNSWNGNWALVTSGQQEGGGFIKPTLGDYAQDMHSFLTRKNPFDLRSPEIRAAELSLWTRFEIEKNFDYAALSFSIDSGFSWTNVCTDKSALSSPFSQQAGADSIIPIWDGNQRIWQKEYIDLHDFLGYKLWIRFLFHSDQNTEFSGFGVDNIRITTHTLTTGIPEIEYGTPEVQVVPNPGSSEARIVLKGLKNNSYARIRIVNSLGQLKYEGAVQEGHNQIPGVVTEPGIYFIEIRTGKGEVVQTKWIKEVSK